MRVGFIGLAAALVLGGCDPLAGQGSGEKILPEQLLVVADGTPPTRMGEVSTGQPNLIASAMPTEFEAVDANPRCSIPRPTANAKVAFAYTYGGGVKTPLQYIADGASAEHIAAQMAFTKEVARQVAKDGNFLQAALAREAAGFAKGNSVEWTKRIDVLVTETEAPVYLVLTSYNSILWNIQLAPGAKIDGIVVSGYEGGAIANGVDHRRTAFMGFDGSPNSGCYLKGRGRPATAETRIASAKELNPDFDASRYRDGWEAEYRANMKFFSSDMPRKIGNAPKWLLTDARGGTYQAILVGPRPDVPFEQQPITRLQIPSYIAPYWGSRKGAFAYFGLE